MFFRIIYIIKLVFLLFSFHLSPLRAEGPEAPSPGQHPGYKRKINLFSRKHKRNPPKTCRKEKYFLFLQADKMHFYEIFKQAFIALVCITNILNYIIMLGTELPHVVQARAEGPEAPSPG